LQILNSDKNRRVPAHELMLCPLKMVLEHVHRFGGGAWTDAERPLNNAGFAEGVIREVEDTGLTLAQGTHDLEALDCRIF
jgi:hypothetical protein